ncbi:hypothetical protein TUBRATIS_11690 [Tubulinosema ratisbonensis]|uniref:Uncharacterized protein n=1 Tax=Tubulinosema ratisbonensis TaxID=291195 RepID=A0A437AMS6_9MICR|nr:hypothetical protein TUBRATIS_11690 [Tubulinosema ratisbonensis]
MPSNHEILLSCIKTTTKILERIKQLSSMIKKNNVYSDKMINVLNELNNLIDKNISKSLIHKDPGDILRKCLTGVYLEECHSSDINISLEVVDNLNFNENYEELQIYLSISNEKEEWNVPEEKERNVEYEEVKETNKIVIKKNKNNK